MKKKRLASLLPCRLLPCLSSHPTHSRRPDLNLLPPPPPPSTSLSPPHLGPGSSRRGGAPRPTTAAADSQPCPRRSGPRSARIWLPSSPPTGWERLGHARLPRPAATVGDAACRRARPRAVTGRTGRAGEADDDGGRRYVYQGKGVRQSGARLFRSVRPCTCPAPPSPSPRGMAVPVE